MEPGLFISTGAVGTALDLDALTRHYATTLPTVMLLEDFYAGGQFDRLLAEVTAKKLEAVVLAGESPLAYKQTRNGDHLMRCLAERGVNPNRVEVVNLKNMVVRAHHARREALQDKAKLLIDVGLARVRSSTLTSTVEVTPRQAVAIIGGNAASVALAQHLLESGTKVFMVARQPELTLSPEHAAHLLPTLAYVTHHERFTLFAGATPIDFSGFTGDFVLKIRTRAGEHEFPVGAVVLSAEPNPSLVKELQTLFHVDVDDHGRIAAKDDVSARSQTHDRGVFVINPAHAQTGDLATELLAADATAISVMTLLNHSEIHHRVTVSEVRSELCGGCGVCVKTCAFHAASLRGELHLSVIDPRRCRGCGNCVTACPSGARDLEVCSSEYLSQAIDILAGFKGAPGEKKVLLMACEGCGYVCLDRAADEGQAWPVAVMPLKVVCGGQIDTQLLLQAFLRGFDGVILTICGEGCCHNLIGNVDLERRVNLFRDVLSSRGINPARVQIISNCSRSSTACVESINKFYAQLMAAKRTVKPAQVAREGSV
jgi:heterodisulfide reductase subunit A-like polyferredoxin/coenzyme F420-reducing hydrogenase delta subunit